MEWFISFNIPPTYKITSDLYWTLAVLAKIVEVIDTYQLIYLEKI